MTSKRETSWKTSWKTHWETGRQAQRQAQTQAGSQAERHAGRQTGKQAVDKLGDKGGKAFGRRRHHPSKGNKEETSWKTRPREGGHTIQQRESRRKTSWETIWESWTRHREGGHTIQQKHTCGETMGHKGRQDLGKEHTCSEQSLRILMWNASYVQKHSS